MTFLNVSEPRNMGLYIIHATAVALAADIWKAHPGMQRSDPLVWLLRTCKMGLQGNQQPFALTIPTTKTFCSHRRLHYIGLVIFHPSCDQICGNFF
jgi:hypothetical protein